MFDILVYIESGVGERYLVYHVIGRGGLEGPANVLFSPAREENIDGEFEVVNTGSEFDELSNGFAILAFIERINYDHSTVRLFGKSSDGIDY